MYAYTFVCGCFLFLIQVLLNEIALLRFLHVFKYNFIAVVNDYFLATFFALLNIVICVIVVITQLMTGVVECGSHYSMMGAIKRECIPGVSKTGIFL